MLIKNFNNKKIIMYYSNVICCLINYYRITNNLNQAKKFIINLIWNYLRILSKKYKKSIKWIWQICTSNVNLNIKGAQILSLPTFKYIESLQFKYTIFRSPCYNGSLIEIFFKHHLDYLSDNNVSRRIKF